MPGMLAKVRASWPPHSPGSADQRVLRGTEAHRPPVSPSLPRESQESELRLEGKIGVGQADEWQRAFQERGQPVPIPGLAFSEERTSQTSS